MTAFLTNLVLAIIWRAATGGGGLTNLLFGFIVSFFVLKWVSPLFGDSRYFQKLPRAVTFLVWFLWEVVQSNFRVAWDVITPKAYRKPGIIAVPLDVKTDAEITVLANLLTLTPGTLSLDVSDDRRVLYVHAMFVDDPEETRREIKESFERRVIDLLS